MNIVERTIQLLRSHQRVSTTEHQRYWDTIGELDCLVELKYYLKEPNEKQLADGHTSQVLSR